MFSFLLVSVGQLYINFTAHLVGIHPHVFIVSRCSLLGCFLLALRAPAEEDVVDQSVLEQGQEDKDKAAHKVHVDGLHVGNFGEGLSEVGVDGSHGEHGGDTWSKKTEFSFRDL